MGFHLEPRLMTLHDLESRILFQGHDATNGAPDSENVR